MLNHRVVDETAEFVENVKAAIIGISVFQLAITECLSKSVIKS